MIQLNRAIYAAMYLCGQHHYCLRTVLSMVPCVALCCDRACAYVCRCEGLVSKGALLSKGTYWNAAVAQGEEAGPSHTSHHAPSFQEPNVPEAVGMELPMHDKLDAPSMHSSHASSHLPWKAGSVAMDCMRAQEQEQDIASGAVQERDEYSAAVGEGSAAVAASDHKGAQLSTHHASRVDCTDDSRGNGTVIKVEAPMGDSDTSSGALQYPTGRARCTVKCTDVGQFSTCEQSEQAKQYV